MNNIEILEIQLKKIKDFCKDNKHYYPEELPYYMFWNGKQAEIVENLIQENKELKENLKIATAMLTKGTYPEEKTGDNDFSKQFIAKSKVKEKIEELEKLQDNNRKDMEQALNFLNFKQIDKVSVAIIINMSVRDILNQLLEEGE